MPLLAPFNHTLPISSQPLDNLYRQNREIGLNISHGESSVFPGPCYTFCPVENRLYCHRIKHLSPFQPECQQLQMDHRILFHHLSFLFSEKKYPFNAILRQLQWHNCTHEGMYIPLTFYRVLQKLRSSLKNCMKI